MNIRFIYFLSAFRWRLNSRTLIICNTVIYCRICLLLTSILFCRKRYLPKILWKYLIFQKTRQKRTYFKINNSFCSFFLSELSQLVIFRCFSTFLLSNLPYLVAVLLKNCHWKVAWHWNSEASRTSTLKNLLSLFK